MPATLASAGLLDHGHRVRSGLLGVQPRGDRRRDHGSDLVNPKAYAGWLMVDAAPRLSLDMEPGGRVLLVASLPTFLVDDPARKAQEILDCCNGDGPCRRWKRTSRPPGCDRPPVVDQPGIRRQPVAEETYSTALPYRWRSIKPPEGLEVLFHRRRAPVAVAAVEDLLRALRASSTRNVGSEAAARSS